MGIAIFNIYLVLFFLLVHFGIVRFNLFWKASPAIVLALLLFGLLIPTGWGAPQGYALVVRNAVSIVPDVAGEVADVPVVANVPLRSIDATLTGPRGNAISGSVSDNRTTLTDVFYQGTLKWNQGVHNEMVYITGNIPSGTYDSSRLANLSFGFPAVDAGAGYTYLDPKSGHEFSVVSGLTYSFMNGALQYLNGMDFHVDGAASQFVSKNVHIGIAGYFLQQITDDSGPGAKPAAPALAATKPSVRKY